MKPQQCQNTHRIASPCPQRTFNQNKKVPKKSCQAYDGSCVLEQDPIVIYKDNSLELSNREDLKWNHDKATNGIAERLVRRGERRYISIGGAIWSGLHQSWCGGIHGMLLFSEEH